MKIRDKILLYSILVSILLMTVFIWASSSYIQYTLQKNVLRVVETNADKVRSYLNNIEYTVNLSIFNTKTSLTVQEYLQGNESAGRWTRGILRDVANRECISSLELYDAEGKFLMSSEEEQEEAGSRSLSEEFLEEMNRQRDVNCWSAVNMTGEKSLAGELQVARAIVSEVQGAVLGYVRVCISSTSLTGIFNYVGFNVSSEMCIMSANGKLILPDSVDAVDYQIVRKAYREYAESEETAYNYSDEKYTIDFRGLEEYGVLVVVMTRTADIRAELAMIQRMIYLLGAICLLLVVLVSAFLSGVMSSPLIRLTREVEKIGWDSLDFRVDVDSYREIEILSGAFNQMLKRAGALMEEVETAQKRKRMLELQNLQGQITPHFLYNSLESLSALALMGDNETVYQMAKALGIFYRDVLSDGRDVISIQTEIDIIQNYLLIESIRYADKFTYRVQVDPAILDCRIVKLTLQPLVENAIYHGIREVPWKGILEITGRLDGDEIVLCVRDNGKGMPDSCREIHRHMESGENHGDLILHRKGFGMANVDERLQLYFGSKYGLSVRSGEKQGTCIEVRLPALRSEGEGRSA